MKALRAVAAVLLLAAPVSAKGTTDTLAKPFDDVWKATLAVVAEEFTLSDSNREDGMISFRSGTQDCSALVVRVDDANTSITVNSKTARSGLSIGMGKDGNKVKGKLLKKVREKLGLPPAKD